MPVHKKHLEGPTFPQVCKIGTTIVSTTNPDITDAIEKGAEAFRHNASLADCPPEFRPVMGSSRLYDAWVIGYKGAAVADGGGCD